MADIRAGSSRSTDGHEEILVHLVFESKERYPSIRMSNRDAAKADVLQKMRLEQRRFMRGTRLA
jgi:hypothetical protein